MKIAVLGGSAEGNVLGALLAQTGEQVQLIDTNQLHIGMVASQGLWVDSANGRFHVNLQAGAQLTERPDICLLATTVPEIVPTLQANKGFLENVPVVTLQNNPHAAELAASVLGKQYILSAVVLFGARLQPGHVSYPVPGSLLIGEPYESTGFAEALVALLGHVVQTIYVDNIHGAQWTRLITNLHLSLAAMTGMSAEAAADHPILRPLSVSMMREATDITKAAGIQLQSLPDLPPVNKIVSVLHLPEPVSEMIPRLLGKVQRDVLAAANAVMNIKQEGKTAIEYVNGEVARLGQSIGQPAHYNLAVVELFDTAAGTQYSPQQLADTIVSNVKSRQMTAMQN